MKLYTEEQVRKAISSFHISDWTMQDVIDRLKHVSKL